VRYFTQEKRNGWYKNQIVLCRYSCYTCFHPRKEVGVPFELADLTKSIGQAGWEGIISGEKNR
jgi:hypothetical protein